MSSLTDLALTWPERTPVAHRETSATGRISTCPPRDPISADQGGGPRAHLFLGGAPLVWVAWSDREGCWMRPRALRKAGKEGR